MKNLFGKKNIRERADAYPTWDEMGPTFRLACEIEINRKAPADAARELHMERLIQIMDKRGTDDWRTTAFKVEESERWGALRSGRDDAMAELIAHTDEWTDVAKDYTSWEESQFRAAERAASDSQS